MRCELSDYEWTAIKPMLESKPRGVRRRVLNGIFWDREYDADWIRVLAGQQGGVGQYSAETQSQRPDSIARAT
jgi:transposase